MSASAAATVPQVASSKAQPASNETGWRRHYLLLVLLLVYGVSMVDRQILGVLIEPINKEMGVSDGAMGLLTGLAFALLASSSAAVPAVELGVTSSLVSAPGVRSMNRVHVEGAADE